MSREITPTRRALGRDFRERRERAGMNQPDLAKLTGIPQSEISRIESGRRLPTMEQLRMFARAFGVKPSTLVRAIDRQP